MTVHADDPFTFSPVPFARVMTWAQFAYVAWFGVCVAVVLIQLDHVTGHLYVPAQADGVSDNVDIWTGWAHGLQDPVALTGLLGPAVALFGAVVAASSLLWARVRAHRWLVGTLVLATALNIATVVVLLMPAGASITGWILD